MPTPQEVEAQRLADDLDLRAVMRTEEGSRLLLRIIEQTGHVSRTVPSEGAVDPLRSTWLEGRRDVGIRLHAELARVCPELLLEAEVRQRRLALSRL